ncbi:MAG: hypothetical protein Harvfovirus10_18 [Harvfovirus sp.]|uniref:Uncharacterized protein n=1 Tax=Harvfovirus sp. TaxID=2487768 RepID=A0A3G5A1A5_9VIRU|nr:MAG: hypothetical protein Harvfovirus10_18 [Harvfovirus sp.]
MAAPENKTLNEFGAASSDECTRIFNQMASDQAYLNEEKNTELLQNNKISLNGKSYPAYLELYSHLLGQASLQKTASAWYQVRCAANTINDLRFMIENHHKDPHTYPFGPYVIIKTTLL